MKNWIYSVNNENNENNIVISSRIRLARNIEGIAFPHRIDSKDGKSIVKDVEKAFYNTKYPNEYFKTIYLWENDLIKNRVFFDKHLISYKLVSNMDKSAFIVNDNETISIMINEEDHLRIQAISAGLNLKETFDVADKFDDLLEEKVNYAFDEQLGYLTACPTNLGTGLRASVMLHLPILSMQNEMDKIFNTVSKIGMTVRGLYGEGSNVQGNLYQISNQITLGLEEEEILNNLLAVVKQIINQEHISREKVMNKYSYEFKDKIFRSLGLLRSAYLLQMQETLGLLSNVRLGVEMGIIKDVTFSTLNQLLIDISDASIQLEIDEKLSSKELAYRRAEIVRNKLQMSKSIGGDNNDV